MRIVVKGVVLPEGIHYPYYLNYLNISINIKKAVCLESNNKKLLSEKEQQALEEIKKRVRLYFPVTSFILFGSIVRGNNQPGSDIDLLIVIDASLSRNDKYLISDEIFEVNLAYSTNFSMIVEEQKKWESELWSYLPLHRNVEKEGVLV